MAFERKQTRNAMEGREGRLQSLARGNYFGDKHVLNKDGLIMKDL